MIDLKLILQKTDIVKQKLATKGFDPRKIDDLVVLGKKRSELMTSLQKLLAERNKLSKTIGAFKARNEDVTTQLQEVEKLKKQIIEIQEQEVQTNDLIYEKLLNVPNLPLPDTPMGQTEMDNKVLAEHWLGRKKVKNVLPHYEIATTLGLVDFKRAVKMAGARFWAYKNQGAKLVRALESFMLDEHQKRGYQELYLPLILQEKMLIGTAQLPKFKDDLFKIDKQNSYLISTSEIALVNYHNREIIDLTKPLSYTAFSPCFRKEAGAGGKDAKGLIRAHQFYKVELVKFTSKEDKEREFQKMLKDASHILEALELPYRQVRLCSGDLGFAAEKTVDLEVWMPSEQKFREVSSVSSTGDFQSRRALIRYKDKDNQKHYACTLNGSGLAIDRIVAAILENYQNDDKTISVPKALMSYFNNSIIK